MSKEYKQIKSTVELDLKKYKDKTIESIMKEIGRASCRERV